MIAAFPYPPTPIGTGPKFHPPAATHRAGVRCAKSKRYGVHVELFARNRVIIVPAGIDHPCMRTRWPVGIVELRGHHTLGDFFRVWGQPLSRTRLVGFKTRGGPAGARLRGREALARADPEHPAATALQHRARARALHSAAQAVPLPARPVKRGLLILPLAAVLAGCSSGSDSGTPTITIPKAHVYKLVDRSPTTGVKPGKPVTVGFTVQQPSGQALTKFKTGPGPHTGVHVIIVADDLSTIIHRHPPPNAQGHVSEQVVLPRPGDYTVLADVYPRTGQLPNFQLRYDIHADGKATPKPLPAFKAVQKVDGYTVDLHGKPEAAGRGAQDPQGHGHRAERQARAVRRLVRRARARGLLPEGDARVFPHACLRAEHARLYLRPRPALAPGRVDQAGCPARGRPAAGVGDVGALPPVQVEREDRDRPVYVEGALRT